MIPEAPVHLLVIEPDTRLRDLLRQYLKSQRFLVSLARDADHARRLLSGLEFDLIVLDGNTADASALCASVSAPILLLLDKDKTAPRGTESITKPFEPKALIARIDDVLDRRPPPEPPKPQVVTIGTLSFDIERCALTREGASVKLTATEAQLMRILVGKLGAPVGRGELIARLGRKGINAKARAVDVQITRLRRKIESDPRNPRHLHTVRGAGYMLAED